MEDIEKPKILTDFANSFMFLITSIVNSELSKSRNFSIIEHNDNFPVFSSQFSIKEVLKPFFSNVQTMKGEHEVIALAFLLHRANNDFHLILDEDGPRKFVTRQFSFLAHKMTGTVGFLGKCHCEFKIVQKQLALDTLQEIEQSKFRVDSNILNSIKCRIKDC